MSMKSIPTTLYTIFNIVQLGFYRDIPIFLSFLIFVVAVLTCTHNQCFIPKNKGVSNEIFNFTAEKKATHFT